MAHWPVRANGAQFSGWRSGPFTGRTFCEAVAFAVHFEDADMVGQPVEERPGQALGTEGFGPFIKRQIE